jgi:acyl carrier protein
MTTAEVIQRMRQYITDNFLYARPGFELADETSLLESGVIDSMGIIEVVQFIETELGCPVGDDDITEENLDSLAAIGRFVSARRAAIAA